MATRPSRQLRTSLQSSLQAGFYFLLALASVSLCGIFQSQKWGKLFALAALLYLLFLLKDKYGGLFKLALAFLLLLTLVLAKDQVKLGEPAGDIRLYPTR